MREITKLAPRANKHHHSPGVDQSERSPTDQQMKKSNGRIRTLAPENKTLFAFDGSLISLLSHPRSIGEHDARFTPGEQIKALLAGRRPRRTRRVIWR